MSIRRQLVFNLSYVWTSFPYSETSFLPRIVEQFILPQVSLFTREHSQIREGHTWNSLLIYTVSKWPGSFWGLSAGGRTGKVSLAHSPSSPPTLKSVSSYDKVLFKEFQKLSFTCHAPHPISWCLNHLWSLRYSMWQYQRLGRELEGLHEAHNCFPTLLRHMAT